MGLKNSKPEASAHRRQSGKEASIGRLSSNSEKSHSSQKSASLKKPSSVKSNNSRGTRRMSLDLLRGENASIKKRHNLEQQLATIIQDKAKVAGSDRRRMTFARLILKIPTTLNKGFKKCRKVFAQLDEANIGLFNNDQIKQAAIKLGYSPSDQEIQQIFIASDFEMTQSLDYKEMVVVLAILHLLRGPADDEQIDDDILAAFNVAEEAFLSFDSSADGYISKDEIQSMMEETYTQGLPQSPAGGDPIGKLAGRRFEELDVDGDGKIGFIEFLFALEGWAADGDLSETESDEMEED